MNCKGCDAHNLSTVRGKQKRGTLAIVHSVIKYYIDINLNYHAEGIERRSNKK